MDAESRRKEAKSGDVLYEGMNIDDKPSYLKLMKHISSMHPRKELNDTGGKKFGICDELGFYPLCCCKQRAVSPMAKEIGLGPTMFLISAKTLAWFFVVLTILNVPTYMFFYKSNQTANCSTSDLQGCFDKLSMGSIGQSEIACATVNFAKSRELELACFTSNAKLTEIKFVGIAKDNETSCKKLNKAPYASKGEQFFDKCYVNNLDANYDTFARNTD